MIYVAVCVCIDGTLIYENKRAAHARKIRFFYERGIRILFEFLGSRVILESILASFIVRLVLWE